MKRENKKSLYDQYQSTHFSFIRKDGEKNHENLKRSFESYYGKFLPGEKETKIIDIACGNGTFLSWIRDKGYKDIFGIDISEEQTKIAKQQLGSGIISTIDAFEFLYDKNNEYDMVVALDLIEHFEKEEILELLKLVYKALKPQGKLLLSVPNAENPFGANIRYGDFTHEIAFTGTSLSQVLRLCGFKAVRLLRTEPIIHNLKSLFRFLIWKFAKQIIRIYLLAGNGSGGSGIYCQTISALATK